MLPEEKVARRFSELRGLVPPIDVEYLVNEAADLEADFLPAGYDAVFLDKSAKYPRPRIIIETGLSSTRRAFTLAHELGHIVIPWHNGTHFCRVDGDTRLVDELTAEVESQANRFAGELLMPAAWVRGLIKSKGALADLIEAVRVSGVSYHAASIRLINLLPTGFLFVELDSGNKLVRASSSSDTWIRLPERGSPFAKAQIDSLADESVSFKSGSSRILWWRLSDKLSPPKRTFGSETSSEMIKRICLEVFGDKEEARRAVMSVNGVIGAANGTNIRELNQDLFTVLKQRFLGRRELAAVVTHDAFNEFLARRAEELKQRSQ
jgi:Zn-dependent peptidase ImmA (M78 family)